MNWIVKGWRGYIAWCDRMGLTPENRRSCAPRLQDPELRPVIDNSDKRSPSKSGE
ncbi:hypothetical protein [Shewanella hanedai]|jgi:hypothetical protein|uniref:hypothetical protein n=1 Tax=Shewanella hanedai TaxID=25 RepID=UPI00163DCFC1|nr:hypothetical protein [Shewanella hanedai]